MKLCFLIICCMFKAWIIGVPKVLSCPPCSWLSCPANLPPDPEAALLNIAGRVDQIFQSAPFKYHFFYSRKCLLRSFVMVWFARKVNAEVVVHFGLKNRDQKIQIHCWLSYFDGNNTKSETNSGYQEIWHYRVAREVTP